MARRGRPRKTGPRQPNGHLSEAHGDRPSDAHLIALGANPKDRKIHNVIEARRIVAGAGPKDAEASTPLGLMLARGLITDKQHRAGLLYELNQLRLGRHIGGPNDTRSHLASLLAQSGSAAYRDMGEDTDDFMQQWRRCRWVEREIAARVWDWRALDALIVRHEPPCYLDYGPGAASVQLATIRHDLDAVAAFYERPPEMPHLSPRSQLYANGGARQRAAAEVGQPSAGGSRKALYARA